MKELFLVLWLGGKVGFLTAAASQLSKQQVESGHTSCLHSVRGSFIQ